MSKTNNSGFWRRLGSAFERADIDDGESAWNAECEGGESFAVISRADGTTDVLECEALERQTGTACWDLLE